MDAARKLDVEKPYDTVPPPYRYWLEKRDGAVQDFTPSTYRD